jgi:hypothetical protein
MFQGVPVDSLRRTESPRDRESLSTTTFLACALFTVTSSLNRVSVAENGLDWDYMARPGIAGSESPEVAGVFLCLDESEVEWSIRVNNTGGPVDVWSVEGIDVEALLDNGSGYSYICERIPPARLTLVRRDLPKPPTIN